MITVNCLLMLSPALLSVYCTSCTFLIFIHLSQHKHRVLRRDSPRSSPTPVCDGLRAEDSSWLCFVLFLGSRSSTRLLLRDGAVACTCGRHVERGCFNEGRSYRPCPCDSSGFSDESLFSFRTIILKLFHLHFKIISCCQCCYACGLFWPPHQHL